MSGTGAGAGRPPHQRVRVPGLVNPLAPVPSIPSASARIPRPGDVVRIDGGASVQFAGNRAITVRVVSADPVLPYSAWVWLSGYVLNAAGEAVEKREVFVQLAGIRTWPRTPGTR